MKRSRTLWVGVLGMAASVMLPVALSAANEDNALVRFGTSVGATTSLRVSSSELRIEPSPAGSLGPHVVGTIEYVAAARTHNSGEVVLTVEALAGLDTLPGSGNLSETAIEFEGSASGAMAGVLSTSPEVAARWVGSGIRSGRLTFTVRGAGPQHTTAVPLRFVISTP